MLKEGNSYFANFWIFSKFKKIGGRGEGGGNLCTRLLPLPHLRRWSQRRTCGAPAIGAARQAVQNCWGRTQTDARPPPGQWSKSRAPKCWRSAQTVCAPTRAVSARRPIHRPYTLGGEEIIIKIFIRERSSCSPTISPRPRNFLISQKFWKKNFFF